MGQSIYDERCPGTIEEDEEEDTPYGFAPQPWLVGSNYVPASYHCCGLDLCHPLRLPATRRPC